MKIWLNGQVVHDNNTQRGVMPDQEEAAVTLKAGDNEVLMKVVNYGNAYGFFFRRWDEQNGASSPFVLNRCWPRPPRERSDADWGMMRDFYRQANSPGNGRVLNSELAKSRRTRPRLRRPAHRDGHERDGGAPETFVLVRGQYYSNGEESRSGCTGGPAPPPDGRAQQSPWLRPVAGGPQ